ncbi:hypothetical protein QRE66_18870 [Bacillus cereus]|nr:hypothetical protein QRE66_18870 [Bacillus cereus]
MGYEDFDLDIQITLNEDDGVGPRYCTGPPVGEYDDGVVVPHSSSATGGYTVTYYTKVC